MANAASDRSMEFAREPRLPVPPVAQSDVVIEKPPDIPKVVPVNPLARLAPLAMLVAAGGMMAVYFTSGASPMRNPMFMFFPVMMLSSVIGTLAYGRGANRTAEINEDRRNYLRYLDTLDSEIVSYDRRSTSVAAMEPPRARGSVDPDRWPTDVGEAARRCRLLPCSGGMRRPTAVHAVGDTGARAIRGAGPGHRVCDAQTDSSAVGRHLPADRCAVPDVLRDHHPWRGERRACSSSRNGLPAGRPAWSRAHRHRRRRLRRHARRVGLAEMASAPSAFTDRRHSRVGATALRQRQPRR